MARRGARQVVSPTDLSRVPPVRSAPDAEAPDAVEIIDEAWDPAETTRPAQGRAGGDTRPGRPPRTLPPDITAELADQVGARAASGLERKLIDAARAYERERFPEALSLLRPVVRSAPGSGSARELMGLSLYRLGRWSDAAAHLEAHRDLTGAVHQLPVLADCYRALKRYPKVDELWQEVGAASPAAGIVAEGRIVAAGALADQGRLRQAIALLEKAPGPKGRRGPAMHHLRTWYALADLYERAGDIPRARRLFGQVAVVEPDLADTAARLAALG